MAAVTDGTGDADAVAGDEPVLLVGETRFELCRAAEVWPEANDLAGWIEPALTAAAGMIPATGAASVTLLFADDATVRRLNHDFRGKDRPTNVLSFPAPEPNIPEETRHIGDVVLAGETIAAEATDQGKTLKDHTIHLVLHGYLHLRGFDHEDDDAAAEMEALEQSVLAQIGIADPYGET